VTKTFDLFAYMKTYKGKKADRTTQTGNNGKNLKKNKIYSKIRCNFKLII